MKDFQALLLICDDAWVVVDALSMSDRRINSEPGMIGKEFIDLIDEQSQAALDLFVRKLTKGSYVSDTELQLNFKGNVAPVKFFGCRFDDRYVISAGIEMEEILALIIEPSVRAEPGRKTLLHRFIMAFMLRSMTDINEAVLFVDISRLNNEIVNTNRELSKRNFELFLEKERNRVTIASIGDAVVATDVNGKITLMNTIAEQLTGWSSNDGVGRDVSEVVQFVDIDARPLHHLFITSLADSIPSNLPLNAMLVRRDKKNLQVEDSIAPIKDISGRTIGLVITFRDISERKRAEEALRESEEKFHEIFDHANDAIHVHEWSENGNPGKFIDVNNVACRMLGYTHGEMLLMQPFDIATSYHDPPLEEVLDCLRTKGWAKFETEHCRKDGSIVPVEINSHVVNMMGSKITVAVVRDITERKRMERVVQLANAKLGIMNSITRHDILNQMTALNGYLELCKLREKDSKLISYFDKMSQATGNIQKQIAFTKDYQDMGIKAPAWVSVGRHTTDAFDMLHPKGVSLEDTTGGVEILADQLTEKVPYNLIDNSMRHGERVAHIKISAEQVGDAMNVVYEDDGVGISALDGKHLFEKGFGKNTGLGLFFIREILAITGITITETGKAGQGVRFEMLVPPGEWRRPLSR